MEGAVLLGRLRPARRVEIAMSASISRKHGWVLTGEAFDRMLAELHPDIERAGEQYEKIRRKLVKLFEWRGCAHSEECADETFNRVAQKISEGNLIWTEDPYSYFHGVALNVLREYWRSVEQTAKALEEVAQIQDLSVDPEHLSVRQVEQTNKERLLECLNQCLQKLPPESLHLITRYHQIEESSNKARRKELAQSLGIPINALRIRAYRIRSAIEECVEKCLENEHEPAG
jgi:DNA-directed RNA polymerase specialized sigma24 family protein